MSSEAPRIVSLSAAVARHSAASPAERRAAYELARLRLACTHDPPERFAHLARRHD